MSLSLSKACSAITPGGQFWPVWLISGELLPGGGREPGPLPGSGAAAQHTPGHGRQGAHAAVREETTGRGQEVLMPRAGEAAGARTERGGLHGERQGRLTPTLNARSGGSRGLRRAWRQKQQAA